MPIKEHPTKGAIILCDYNKGFLEPEMVKRRPVIVLSPKIHGRYGLCTVVALSTTPPAPVMSYHAQIDIDPPLPEGLQSTGLWVKGDMVNTVGFHRLDLIRKGRIGGQRMYYLAPLNSEQLKVVLKCVLHGMGLASLTKHV